MSRAVLIAVLLLAVALVPLGRDRAALRIGSKKFTESVILGEMLALLVRDTGTSCMHQRELGGTRLVFDALKLGELDAYVDYTGTLQHEIFGDREIASIDDVRRELEKLDLRLSESLGFSNNYALAMRRERAEELNVRTISGLASHPDLVCGFNHEFLERDDGWQPLRAHYSLPQTEVYGIDHDIAYRQIEAGQIDVMDAYTTDAQILLHDLVLLEDDRSFFPQYEAVVVARADVPEVVWASIERLVGRISRAQMAEMNRAVETGERTETQVAADFLDEHFRIRPTIERQTPAGRFWKHTCEHLNLMRVSLLPAIVFGIAGGIVAVKRPGFGRGIVWLAGLVQTVPSLALLVILIPVVSYFGLSSVGTGSTTAGLALFLYALLPIVRNTHTGLKSISPQLNEASVAIGLTDSARLWQVELPLAAPTILAGIKTSAVMNVGFATLGALIGAGGYGQPILTGIRLNDTNLILLGAVASAVLALIVSGLFELVERRLVSPGLRLPQER